MKTHYILIDFENIQPDAFECPSGLPIKVVVFAGEHQHKISLNLAANLQKLGKDVEYVRISGSGQNALDFHVAYWVGRLVEKNPDAHFHIVSKDKGFDPLIKHLKSEKILAQRVSGLSEIHMLNGNPTASPGERVSEVIKSLSLRGNSRPRRRKTLKNTISAMFMKTLKDDALETIIDLLQSRNIISIENEVVSYHFAGAGDFPGAPSALTIVSGRVNDEPENDEPEAVAFLPVNHGKQWTPEEDRQLGARFDSKLSIEAIARKHKRGIGGVQSRLTKLGKIVPAGPDSASNRSDEKGAAVNARTPPLCVDHHDVGHHVKEKGDTWAF